MNKQSSSITNSSTSTKEHAHELSKLIKGFLKDEAGLRLKGSLADSLVAKLAGFESFHVLCAKSEDVPPVSSFAPEASPLPYHVSGIARAHFKGGRSTCPFCGCDALEGQEFDVDGDDVNLEIVCLGCTASWHDKFSYSYSYGYDEGGVPFEGASFADSGRVVVENPEVSALCSVLKACVENELNINFSGISSTEYKLGAFYMVFASTKEWASKATVFESGVPLSEAFSKMPEEFDINRIGLPCVYLGDGFFGAYLTSDRRDWLDKHLAEFSVDALAHPQIFEIF